MAGASGDRWTGQLRRFLRAFLGYAGNRGTAAAAYVAAAAVVEGLGLILIVPLLGIVIGTPHGGRLDSVAGASFNALGLERPFAQLALLLGVFSVLMIVRAMVIAARDVRVAELQSGFVEALRNRIVERLAAARWDRLTQLRHARVTHIMSGDIARIGAMAYQALQCVIAAVVLLVQGVLVFVLAPALASIVAGLVIAAALLLFPGARKMHRLGGAVIGANISLLGMTANFLGGLKLALSQNLQGPFVAEFRHALHEQTRKQVEAMRRQTQRRLALATFSALAAAAIMLVGFGALDVSPPVLIALLVIMTRMAGPVGQIQTGVQQIAFALPVFETSVELERDLSALPAERPAAETINLPDGPIVFHDVTFLHPDDSGDNAQARGLTHVSLTIRPGELVGIAGPSGAGKTTFADLLVGLLPPQQGRIAVGGTVLSGAALPAWRDRVSYISQDPFLFHDTIRRNLSWANPRAGETEMWQALALAGADDLVRRMAQGLDTTVGERGALVSGGERQRLALARAVLRQPRLLVLDEATNALDVAGERGVIERLRAVVPRSAIVVIAHRPESIALCDRVLRFEAGRCVEDTTAAPSAPLAVGRL